MEQSRTVKFIEENLKTIFAYSLSRVSHKEDAEDLTGDIVTAILQSAGRNLREEQFYGYVWAIAANTYKKFLRKRSRGLQQELEEDIPDETDFTETIWEKEERNRLRREISLLSKEYRECTVAYYFEELSCGQISERLNISLEMVKYYLFKTRKILKEGISMEREFGEKSFHPSAFEFHTIFAGQANSAYTSLFSRKLPGQILLAAYDAPMSIRELAMELGVASVYLEDELALLERYRLIRRLSSSRYQTSLVIFTEGYRDEFRREAAGEGVPALEEILTGIREKQEQIRQVNQSCGKMTETGILWALLWIIMRQGNQRFDGRNKPAEGAWDTISPGEEGINYGTTWEEDGEEWNCDAFAGFAELERGYYVSGADFGVLPEKNRYFLPGRKEKLLEGFGEILKGEGEPKLLILTKAEEGSLHQLLEKEIEQMAQLYDRLYLCAKRLMRVHAPGGVEGMTERIVLKTLFFQTVGLIGYWAVKTGILMLPETEGPVALYIREI